MGPEGARSLRSDEDIVYLKPARYHRISNQRTMAAPGHRLGTHHNGRAFLHLLRQPVDFGRELRRLHVVGVAAKSLVTPCVIQTVRLRLPAAPQTLAPACTDTHLGQRSEQPFLSELRVPARPRVAPHIDKHFAAAFPECVQERPDRKRRVPDCFEGAVRHTLLEKEEAARCFSGRLAAFYPCYALAVSTSSRTASSSTASLVVLGNAIASTSSIRLA